KEGEHKKGEYKIRPYNLNHSIFRRGELYVRPLCIRPSYVHPRGTSNNSIGRVIQAFKSITIHQYIFGVKQHNWQPFHGKLWQRNYYEHIIRDERDLNQIRDYIINNPIKWALDEYNPENVNDNEKRASKK
ncbi:MAG: transposase, partial [Nitrospirota bacterium]